MDRRSYRRFAIDPGPHAWTPALDSAGWTALLGGTSAGDHTPEGARLGFVCCALIAGMVMLHVLVICHRIQQPQDMLLFAGIVPIRDEGIRRPLFMREFQFRVIDHNRPIIPDTQLASHLHGNKLFRRTLHVQVHLDN